MGRCGSNALPDKDGPSTNSEITKQSQFFCKNPMKGHQCPKKQTHFKANQTQSKPI
jgi:hypothetical protein